MYEQIGFTTIISRPEVHLIAVFWTLQSCCITMLNKHWTCKCFNILWLLHHYIITCPTLFFFNFCSWQLLVKKQCQLVNDTDNNDNKIPSRKRGMAKLNFVCESAHNSAPSWWIDASFCMVGANVIYFSETKFFELNLFGWHEVNLHLAMFLRPETSSLITQMQPTWKIRISWLKNIGWCNFTSCQPKRVNSKNFVSEK